MTRIYRPVALFVALAAALVGCDDATGETPRTHVDTSVVPEDRPDLMLPADELALVTTAHPAIDALVPSRSSAIPAEAPSTADTVEPPEVFRAGDLELRRLAVTREVLHREPVNPGQRFPAESRPMVAFLELVNHGRDVRVVEVTFVGPDGREVGLIDLDVPADMPRYRTWARSRMVTTAGEWLAEVRDEDGALLGTSRFVLE
jgi:hypothetical protein